MRIAVRPDGAGSARHRGLHAQSARPQAPGAGAARRRPRNAPSHTGGTAPQQPTGPGLPDVRPGRSARTAPTKDGGGKRVWRQAAVASDLPLLVRVRELRSQPALSPGLQQQPQRYPRLIRRPVAGAGNGRRVRRNGSARLHQGGALTVCAASCVCVCSRTLARRRCSRARMHTAAISASSCLPPLSGLRLTTQCRPTCSCCTSSASSLVATAR